MTAFATPTCNLLYAPSEGGVATSLVVVRALGETGARAAGSFLPYHHSVRGEPGKSWVVVVRPPAGYVTEDRHVGNGWPADVMAFCRRRGLAAHLRTAVDLVKESFASLMSLEVRIEQDPEIEAEWLVIEIAVRDDVEAFLDAYDRCKQQWVAAIPWQALSVIRLSYYLR